MSFDPSEAAQELYEQLEDDADLSVDELEEEFSDYSDMFVAKDEAMRSIRNRLDNVEDVNIGLGSQNPVDKTVDELDTEKEPVNVEVQVVTVYDDTHESIYQAGRVGDSSGFCRITEFKNDDSGHVLLEEGQSYRINDALTGEYQGEYNIQITEQTEIEELNEEVEVQDRTTTITAPIVNIQNGSGLIERCSVEGCTYVLQDGRCPEHGDVEGEDDLRIKAHIDNGQEVQTVLMDRELTEELGGLTLEEALELARDKMNRGAVQDLLEEKMIGRYFRIEGLEYDDVIAQEVEFVDGVPVARADTLIQRAEQIEF